MTERIDFTKSEQYTLSIRLSADGFSFSIYNPLLNRNIYPIWSEGNNEIVLCNVLGRSNVVILFAMDKHTHLLLTEHFPTALGKL